MHPSPQLPSFSFTPLDSPTMAVSSLLGEALAVGQLANSPWRATQPDPRKAAHYAVLLDAARSDGNWDAVPECIRKVKKHAPNRACRATLGAKFGSSDS